MKKLWLVVVGVLAGCGTGGYEAVRTTQIEVRPVCPKPGEAPDSLAFLEGVGQISPEAMGLARDRAFDAYLDSGALSDRLSVLVLALTGPPDPVRDGRLVERLSKDPLAHRPARGGLDELDGVLRRVLIERVRTVDHDPAREETRNREIEARLAASLQEIRNLQKRLETQGKRVKTLEAQIEELKSIERIIDRREQASPGG